MNPRIAKEVRAQLFPFGLIICAAVLPFWLFPTHPTDVMVPGFTLACLLMGAAAFGTEFQHRTMAGLLAQPLSRSALWMEKMWVMCGFILAGTMVVALALKLYASRLPEGNWNYVWWTLLLVPICSAGGGPFWTLLLRSSLMGTAFTFLAPAFLLMLNVWIYEKMHLGSGGGFQIKDVCLLLLIYGPTTLLLGFRRFKKLEAYDGPLPSPEVELPTAVGTFFSKPFEAMVRPFAGPFTSLVRKELRLHQFSFLCAAVFSVPVMLVIVMHGGHLDWEGQSSFSAMSIVAGFGIYMGILPVLAGSLSLAEEKSWGVSEWHLTLPPAVRKQWFAKMLVAFGVSLVLGLLLPGLLLWIGKGWPFENNPGSLVEVVVQALMVPVVQLMLISFAIYASSIVAGTIRAMLVCTGMLFAVSPLIRFGAVMGNEYRRSEDSFFMTFDFSEGLIILGGYMCVAAVGVACLLQVFSFMDFRFQRPPARQIGLQLVILFAVILIISVGLGAVGSFWAGTVVGVR
jgi:ABC-type transport system involved in multi-copper enzyme maturation permease subunit